MQDTAESSAYKEYRDKQLAWASMEDLLLIMAKELVRMKDESGTDLFWDESEEQFMRKYIEQEEVGHMN